MKLIDPADEPTERECRDCHERKSIDKFKRMPNGTLQGVCAACSTRKRNKSVADFRAEIKAELVEDDTSSSDKRIQFELWRNYKASKSTAERIRCLEALVKLRPADRKTDLDDSAVIASLTESIKRKKRQIAERNADVAKQTNEPE